MLEVKNLKVTVDDTDILKGVDLTVNPGEIHAIMGPNGSGKSTLAKALAGHEEYEASEGTVLFEDEDLLDMEAEDRARAGLFLAFQYPVGIPGVSNAYFLRSALNAIRAERGEDELDSFEFLELIKEKAKLVDMDESFIHRPVNQGFSGGEKKRNEILQLAVLEPKLAVLDETDSGLDIDALRTVAQAVESLRSDDNAFVIVTHYQRILNYIEPDHVHIMVDGKIAKSGDKNLAIEVEEKGYDWIREELATA